MTKKTKKTRQPHPSPLSPVWIAAFCFYLFIRVTKTLNLGAYTWYGGLVLAVEILGATTVALYASNLILSPVPPAPPAVDEATGQVLVGDAYHVRVVVPCYKESLVRRKKKEREGGVGSYNFLCVAAIL